MSTFNIAIEQLYGIILTTKLQADLSVNLLAGQLTFGTLISAVGSKIDDGFRCQKCHSGCC